MSDDATLVDAASRLFGELARAGANEFDALWQQVRDMGFPLVLVPEERGGLGAGLIQAFAIATASGYHAAALPVPECMIGHSTYAAATAEPDDAVTTVAFDAACTVTDERCTGTLRAVPWGRYSERIAFAHEGRNLLVRTRDAVAAEHNNNPAGESRDTFKFERAPVVSSPGPSVFALGALLRAGQIAGALQASLELSVRYANERVQFGRAIGKFQVIQHNLAVFAEEAAAARTAGEAAARAAEIDAADFEIAAAKCRANKAAACGHATAHAVHGAIGFTLEYPLNRFTRRLLGWRSEFGSQRYWGQWLGRYSLQMAREGFWESLTGRSDKLGLQRLRDANS